jgi:hypothetical protein
MGSEFWFQGSEGASRGNVTGRPGPLISGARIVRSRYLYLYLYHSLSSVLMALAVPP